MKKLYFFILMIFMICVKSQVKSTYDREIEALKKISRMKEEEHQIIDFIYSYRTYVNNYINQNLQYISSPDYKRISNMESTLWKSVMENRNLYSLDSHFYKAAKEQFEYYKSTLVKMTNDAIKKANENYEKVNVKTDNKRDPTLFNPYITRIEGNFKGWDGENIYKTKEGAIWQQADNIQLNYFATSPSVQLYQNEGIIFMKVEGTSYYVKVKRLK